MTAEHEHQWGVIQYGRMTGTPSRPCTVDECRFVSLDLSDDDDDDDDGPADRAMALAFWADADLTARVCNGHAPGEPCR